MAAARTNTNENRSTGARPSWRASLAGWLFGLLALASVIALVLHVGELQELVRLLTHLRVRWLVAGIALQALTYVCAAAIWYLALARFGYPARMAVLTPMALAMLFANQAFPSAGLAGSLLVVRGLERRRIPPRTAMSALIVGLMTTYAAYLAALVPAIVIIRHYSSVRADLIALAALFAFAAVAVPGTLLWYGRSLAPRIRQHASRLPGIGSVLAALESASAGPLPEPRLLLQATAIQLLEMILDAATLAVMLAALGVHVPVIAVFSAFVIAAVFARLLPVPLALGTFEGSLVAALHAIDVPLEAALAGTLLLRGLTLWLPMIPGVWCARWELRGQLGTRSSGTA
jgi:uncharacterized protein (TIRG00374 family)